MKAEGLRKAVGGSVARGGASVERARKRERRQTALTEVDTHTLTLGHIQAHETHQEAQQRKGVVLCRRGPLSFSLGV